MTDPLNSPTRAQLIRKRLFTAVRVLISLGLLVWVLSQMGLEDTLVALKGTKPLWVLIVLALMLLEGLHSTYKWLILLRHTRKDIRFWPLFKITYISGFVGMFLPGAVGIELIRMYGLAKQTSDLAMSFTSVLMDRILGLTGLSLTVLLGVFLVGRESIPGIEYWAGGALLLVIAGWVAIMNPAFRRLTDSIIVLILGATRRVYESLTVKQSATPVHHDGLVRRVIRSALRLMTATFRFLVAVLDMIRDKQNKVYLSLDEYRSRPGLLAWAMVQSLLYNGIRVAVCYATGLAVGVEAPVTAYVVAVPVVIFVMLIPISVGGWGVRELMFVQLLTAYGADGDKAAAMSILVGLLGTVSLFPGAIFCMQGFGKAMAAAKTD